MIKRVTIHDFGVLRDVAVDLEPLTALVGRNEVGKSTILRALQRGAARGVAIESDMPSWRCDLVGWCRGDARTGLVADAMRGCDVLLIDDIDAGLHPVAQRTLIQAIRAKQLDSPHFQVVFSTCSPYLVDELRYEEVRVVARGADGSVRVASLATHPRVALHRCPRAGALWLAAGEDWVVGDAGR